MPSGATEVSPWSTSMSSGSTPRASAAICDQVVTWPCPWGEVPVTTVTLPVGWQRMVAASQPPAPYFSAASTCDGARPQISM